MSADACLCASGSLFSCRLEAQCIHLHQTQNPVQIYVSFAARTCWMGSRMAHHASVLSKTHMQGTVRLYVSQLWVKKECIRYRHKPALNETLLFAGALVLSFLTKPAKLHAVGGQPLAEVWVYAMSIFIWQMVNSNDTYWNQWLRAKSALWICRGQTFHVISMLPLKAASRMHTSECKEM